MSTNWKVGFTLFVVAMLFIFGAIMLCAVENVAASSMIAGLSAAGSLCGLAFALRSWRDDDEQESQTED